MGGYIFLLHYAEQNSIEIYFAAIAAARAALVSLT